MSDIGLDLSALYHAAGLALLGPLLAFLLARRRAPLWRRFLVTTLGGPALAWLAGGLADRFVPGDEIAHLSVIASLPVQALFSLGLLIFRRKS